jgi:hypothetical protein
VREDSFQNRTRQEAVAQSAESPLAHGRGSDCDTRPHTASQTIPEWARQYTDGQKAWRDIIYYWLDRQRPDGTFGFGWGEDCEMIVGWPGVMMATDDKRIEQAIERLADYDWYNPNVQNGYVYLATDSEHGPEPIS